MEIRCTVEPRRACCPARHSPSRDATRHHSAAGWPVLPCVVRSRAGWPCRRATRGRQEGREGPQAPSSSRARSNTRARDGGRGRSGGAGDADSASRKRPVRGCGRLPALLTAFHVETSRGPRKGLFTSASALPLRDRSEGASGVCRTSASVGHVRSYDLTIVRSCGLALHRNAG